MQQKFKKWKNCLTGVPHLQESGVVTPTKLMPTAKTKVIVLLEDEESALLKKLAAESRRTMGQELAFRAFEELRKANLATKTAPRRRRKEAA